MNNKILFMLYNNEIKFLSDPNLDHREWYISLGGNIDKYDDVIRGFVIDDKLIFFKGNLSYDKEVIDVASRCAPIMKQKLNNPNLKVCCGINPGMNGSSWEPIMILNDNELKGFDINLEEETKKQREIEKQKKVEMSIEPVLDFKNNYQDPKFIKFATIFTVVIFVLAFMCKIILFISEKFMLNSFWNVLLLFSQFILLIVTVIGYNKKNKYAKYYGIGASVVLIFMFDIFDIILGIVYLLFTIDQGYIINFFNTLKKGTSKLEKK